MINKEEKETSVPRLRKRGHFEPEKGQKEFGEPSGGAGARPVSEISSVGRLGHSWRRPEGGGTDTALRGPAGVRAGPDAGPVAVPARDDRHCLFLEREREVERIGRILRQAQHGRGGILVVEGPAGIGKTALLAAGRDSAVTKGFRVLRARGAELEREFAFGVVRQLVEPVVAGASKEERAWLLDGPPKVAAELLGLPGLGDRAAAATAVAPDSSFALLHGLYWLCVNLAAERPLLLVVDDAHWADGASLRFLAFLLPRLEELPAAVLLGARPAEAGQSQELLAGLTTDPATEVVTVAPLTTRGVATLVAAGLGAEPEPDFAVVSWEATGGTPFLVHTLVEALRDAHVAPIASSAEQVKQVATATLGRWAMLRLARLGPDAARLARAVAILERAQLDVAARLAGLAPLDAVRADHLLVQAGVLNDAPLHFVHPLLRAAVYRDMGVAERAAAHRQAARLLADAHASPARVAEHLLATAPAGDKWVVDQMRAAAGEAGATGAPESAAVYLRRALTEPPPPEVEAGVLLELGLAEINAGHPDWLHHLEQVVDGRAEDATRVAAALLVAGALRVQGRIAEAVAVCDRVASRPEGCDPESRWRLEAMAVACGLLAPDTAPSVAGRARALVSEATRRPVPTAALAVAAYTAGLINQPAARVGDLVRRATADGLPPLSEPGATRWLSSIAFALIWGERYGEALDLLDSAVTQARRQSNGPLVSTLLAPRAWLALRRGDLVAAEADARAVLEAPGLAPAPLLRPVTACVLVDVLVERGADDLAERELQPLAADLEGTSLMAAVLRYARARLRFAQRQFGAALGDLRAVGDMAIRVGLTSPCWLPWRSEAAMAALACGETETARRLSAEELELARIFGAPRALGVALRSAGLVVGGPGGEALLREAIEVLAGPDTRLEQARAQADLGAQLRRSNHRVQARDLLRQALDVAHRHGATALARRAETELRATGAKPRRALLSGLEALTASERRIAELAAEGLTNREIAQTLFVTGRTVEGHLTNIFTKLDIRARTELPSALSAPIRAARA